MTGSQTRLVGLTREGLKAALAEAGVEPKHLSMRAGQIWNAAYVQGATGFDAITTLAKPLRVEFAERFSLSRPEVVTAQVPLAWQQAPVQGLGVQTVPSVTVEVVQAATVVSVQEPSTAQQAPAQRLVAQVPPETQLPEAQVAEKVMEQVAPVQQEPRAGQVVVGGQVVLSPL